MPSGMKRVFITALDDVYTVDKESVGTIRWEGNKCYKYMQYIEGTAAVDAVAGEVAYYYEDSGPVDNKVCSDLSDCTGDIGAGVLQAIMSDEEYGWFQIKGQATLSIALTAGADGNALTAVGAGDGTLDVSAAVTDAVVAYAVDATAKIIACDFPF